jgi:hypothetical protein
MTATLAPIQTYISRGDGGLSFGDMKVNVVFTPDSSRYIVRGQYTPGFGHHLGNKYELIDNFGQTYTQYDNSWDGKPPSRITILGNGSKEITLELHTIAGDDTREHYKWRPIKNRGYYTLLPSDIIEEIKTGRVTPLSVSNFEDNFTYILIRAYSNARLAANLEARFAGVLKEKEDRIATLDARVKELEALAATPKHDTATVSLLELEDFFGTPSDTVIGNLPEFVHDAE